MDEKKRKNYIIAILCALVLFMGVAYAALSRTLTISGTATIPNDASWNVGISSIDVDTSSDTTVSYNEGKDCANTTICPPVGEESALTTSSISAPATSATLVASLNKPGDYVIYTITVTNYGTIAAHLNSITPYTNAGADFYDNSHTYGSDNIYAKYETSNITITISDLAYVGTTSAFTSSSMDLSAAGGAKTSSSFKVKFQYRPEATTVVTGEKAMLAFNLNYGQAD